MRWPWALALLVLPAVLLSALARADPAIGSPQTDEGLARWTFSNPANYSLQGVDLTASGARLARMSGSVGDTAQTDFEGALLASNVDTASVPGEARIQNTSGLGPPQNLTFQPDPSAMADTYLYIGNGGNRNFGTSPDLRVGNYGGSEWNRALLRFPSLPLPSNATLTSARLQAYMWTYDTAAPMDISAHRVPTAWTELGATWDTADGTTLWNASGGDFDPLPVDTVAGIAGAAGWYTWNITALAQDWWSGTVPNQGLMLRQADDTTAAVGVKQFYSSDAANASLRPRLVVDYVTPCSIGILESRILDAGSTATWDSVWWNATTPPGTALALQTRSGESAVIDGTWGPWSAPVPAPGAPVSSPPARRVQYRAVLFTPDATSPSLRDVALEFGRHVTPGTVVTERLAPGNVSAWGRLEVNWSGDLGTSVEIEISQDDGLSWVHVAAGTNLTSALPGPVTLRLTLATQDTTKTPIVAGFSLGFSIGSAGPTIDPIALWPLAIPLAILAAWVVLRTLSSRRYRPTHLFLIHHHGRLILHVGSGESPMEDELASSGVFTLVVRFVKDSFGGSGPGELKSMTVDEREVVIAKGEFLYLALVLEGARPPELDARLAEFLGSVERARGAQLRTWSGLDTELGPVEEDLVWFLRKGHRKDHPVAGRDSRD